MKFNTRMRRMSNFRVLVGGVLLIVVAMSALFVVRTVHGDDPVAPSSPIGSVSDTQAVFASDTVTAKAEQDETQYAQDVANGVYGTPFPKGAATPPIPPPVITSAVDSPPPPSAGLNSAPSLRAGWSSKYHITNEWYGLVGTNTVIIDAGSKADGSDTATWNSPEQGIIIVSVHGTPGSTEYLAPTRTGRLTITSYSGTCLTLAASKGTNYTFSAQSLSWSCP